jgi:hypothetical protein
MADFDPAKEAINLSKHGVSLARWVDLDVFAIVRMIVSIMASPDIAHTGSLMVFRTASSSLFATNNIARSAFDAHTQKK